MINHRVPTVPSGAPAGCAVLGLMLYLAWMSFIVWAIYTLVEWVVHHH